MAVSIEAAFVLIDRASGPLKKIERQAIATDKALRGMGTGGGGLAGSTTTSKLNSFKDALHEGRKEMSALGGETAKTAKKVDVFSRLFNRTIKPIRDWVKALRSTHPVLAGTTMALGGVLGGVKGVAGALPKLVWLALALTPVIISLAGAIGALGSSLAGAVGGGALLGGGLLGSFAVGLGSIAAIAKPAVTATQNYEKAVKNLNTALASGSPTAIKARQKELNAIAKANPGVAQLSGNLRKFQSEWKKATTPGRASFFKLAADGIQTLRDLLPTLAGEANKNTASLQTSFQKILAPFLRSDTFKGFISGLGGIFRANLPGFMRGLVNVFKGLASILKVLTPQLDRAGPSFARFTGHFAKWAASAGGRSTIRQMGRAFSAWLDLLKQIARVIGSVVGVGMKPGTDQVSKWADKMSGFADKLKKPAAKGSMAHFFSRSLADVDRLLPLLKKLVDSFTQIYSIFKPLGAATSFVLKHLPAPAITALAVGYLGVKGVRGVVGGVKGAADLFEKSKGTYANPMIVRDISGLPGGKGGKGPLNWFKKLGKGGAAAEGEAVAEGAAGTAGRLGLGAASGLLTAAVAEGILLPKSMDWLPKLAGPQRPMAQRTASNPQGIPAAGFQNDTLHNRFPVRRTASNPQGISLLSTPTIHKLAPALSAADVRDYTKRVGAVRNSLATLTPKQLNALKHRGDELARDKSLAKYKTQIEDARDALNNPNSGLSAAARKVKPAFDYMRKGAGKNLDTIVLMSKFAIDEINNTLPAGSKAATDALAKNYQISADDVRVSMAKHVISTQQGIAMISQLMTKAFETLGIKSGVAKKLAKEGWTVNEVQKGLSGGQKSGLTGSSDPNASTTGGRSYQYETGGRLPGRPQGDHLPLLGRGGKLLGIADGGELVVNRHTEARADKYLAAFGTRLSDMVSNETTPHFARGGRTKRTFATGGAIPYSGLEGLWDSAGGPANLAPIMAAIAMAESGGRNVKQAGQPFATTGWGLWQITPGGPQYLDPMTNAREAVAKYRGAGNRLTPWTTYTSGAYRRFMQGNVPPGTYAGGAGGPGGAVAVPVLKPPHVKGRPSPMQVLDQGVVNNVTTAANAFLRAHAPAGMAPGGGGAVPSGAGGTARDPSGKLVAGWIEPILAWARGHGWSGSVTSGYRSYAQQASIYNSGVRPAARPGTSNHEGAQFPRGAVDVSGASQLSSVLSRSPYASTLVWAGAKDPVHFSHPHGGSYALGGRVPWYAKGADFVANRPQVIGVGDAPGGERVTVTPKGQGRIGNQGLHVEIHKIEVHRRGDIQKIVDEELALLATTIESRL